MCGGNFNCSKNALIGLNVCYVMVAFLMIGVATYGKTSNEVMSLPIIGGIAASGAFLLLIAIVGLIGTVRHHQVMLFFYMLILAVIFIIQFSVACACLAVNEEQELAYAEQGWNAADNQTRVDAEHLLGCCGFNNVTEGIDCEKVVPGCKGGISETTCTSCKPIMQGKINSAFNAAGGIGLFFSFTEIVGAVLAYRYRNMMDPRFTNGAAAQQDIYTGSDM